VARVFDRNMLIMLVAIMVGAVVITYFVADIVSKSKIDTLTIEHIVEIQDVQSKNENFTDNFLQGSIMMDSAREVREVANLNFDFALFWLVPHSHKHVEPHSLSRHRAAFYIVCPPPVPRVKHQGRSFVHLSFHAKQLFFSFKLRVQLHPFALFFHTSY